MARLIPNESTWVGFVATLADDTTLVPTEDEIAGGDDLTGFVISINAATQGNTIPTPAFDSLFETSVPGTVQAQFAADFYRDDTADTAWESLPRGTEGYIIISRFGGSGTGNIPVEDDVVEVWPIKVTTRSVQNMASNQVLVFSVQCSVPVEPNEAATVAAGTP